MAASPYFWLFLFDENSNELLRRKKISSTFNYEVDMEEPTWWHLFSFVRPAKAGVFSRDQTCRGKSQTPRSLDGRVEGNRDSEAHRQSLLMGDHESPGRNESERASGLESEWIRGPSLQLKGEGSMGCRNLTDAAP